MINTNGMNVDDEAEVDCILAQADILIPDFSPEKLVAVGLPEFMLYTQRGWQQRLSADRKGLLAGIPSVSFTWL